MDDLLKLCATNLTERASQGILQHAFERDQDVEHIMTALASPLKGRIVVTGGARVGKTAVIHEVAYRLHTENCPESLKGSLLWGLSARSILRAFGIRDWQEKLGLLLQLWIKRPDVILYVDALPSTLMAGATAEDPFDMAQVLLGQLQSSDNRILAEGRTSAVAGFLDAYPEYKHILLEERVPEPKVEQSKRIISQFADAILASQQVQVDELAIHTAIDLTRRFSLNESLPGKAIDLIEETVALHAEQIGHDSRVQAGEVIDRFGDKTGLPRMLLTDDEPYNEQIVRTYFSERVLGQDQAVEVIVQALSLLRTRLNNPKRPMGVFLFIGPTGVGKTELARALSRYLFASDELIVRFNMADYTQDWHTSIPVSYTHL
ncbi:MAG: AAA domain-containing protein, partial [Chloroflexi bacterium]|nr:AAA domain-containing protein [Chloroflexota bacterium]